MGRSVRSLGSIFGMRASSIKAISSAPPAFRRNHLKSDGSYSKLPGTLAVKVPVRDYTRVMAASSPELKAFLVATPFFGGLSDAGLDLLIAMLVECRFDAGATVVAQGEPGRSMFIVHSGALAVSTRGDSGGAIRRADLKAGDFFGEMTIIEMQNRSATVVAERPTVLYELTARNLYAYYKADIHAYVMVMQNINRELCRRLRRADNRIAELADASRKSMTQ